MTLFRSVFGVLQSGELRLELHLHPSWETPSRSSQESRTGPRGKLRGREAPASPQPAAGILLLAAAGLSPLWGEHPSARLTRGMLKSTHGPTRNGDAPAQRCADSRAGPALDGASSAPDLKQSEIQHWLQGYRAVIREEFYLARGTALAKMFSQASLGKSIDLSKAQPCEGALVPAAPLVLAPWPSVRTCSPPGDARGLRPRVDSPGRCLRQSVIRVRRRGSRGTRGRLPPLRRFICGVGGGRQGRG